MRKLITLGVMLAMVLAFAAPAWADTVTAGGLIAGTLPGGAVVAGSPDLAVGAPNLGLGEDAAGAGDPDNTAALGVNDPFVSDFALAAGGSFDNAVFTESDFLGHHGVFIATGGTQQPIID